MIDDILTILKNENLFEYELIKKLIELGYSSDNFTTYYSNGLQRFKEDFALKLKFTKTIRISIEKEILTDSTYRYTNKYSLVTDNV